MRYSYLNFTRKPESHACKGVDEWLSVQGSAPRRNPVSEEAAAVRPWSFTGVLLIIIAVGMAHGCGYTTQSLLPSTFRTIYVDNFKNGINISAEQSNIRMYRGYRPGMEVELTNAVRNKFLVDGNLKLAEEPAADIVLRAELIDYQRQPVTFDMDNNIEQYRIKLIINMNLEDVKAKKVVWEEKGFAGEDTYFTQGPYSMSEQQAVVEAIDDLARRVVERTIEAW